MSIKSICLDDLQRTEKYFLMTSTIVPRPIAVVGTLNIDGTDNLAAFSYFNAVSTEPPCIMFSITHSRTGKKDTLINVERNEEFVIHIAQSDQLEIVNDTSEALPYGSSEREKLKFSLSPSQWIKTPRVNEFKVAFECVLEKLVDIGGNTVVFGKIVGAHIEETLLLTDPSTGVKLARVDSHLLDPLARMDRDYGAISLKT